MNSASSGVASDASLKQDEACVEFIFDIPRKSKYLIWMESDDAQSKSDLLRRIKKQSMLIAFNPSGIRRHLDAVQSELEKGEIKSKAAAEDLMGLLRDCTEVRKRIESVADMDVREALVAHNEALIDEIYKVGEEHRLALSDHVRRSQQSKGGRNR